MNKKKRNWIIGISVSIFILIVVSFFLLQPVFRKKSSATEAIPADAEMIFELKDPFGIGKRWLKMSFWSSLDTLPEVKQFIADFLPLDSIIRTHESTAEFFTNATLYASLHLTPKGYRILYTCNLNGKFKEHFIDQFVVKSNKTHPLEKITYEHGSIRRMKLSLSNRFLHYAIKEDIWIASFDINMVESALLTLHKKNGFPTRNDFELLMATKPVASPFGLICSPASLFRLAGFLSNNDFQTLLLPDAFQSGQFSIEPDSMSIHLNGLFPLVRNKGWMHALPEKEDNLQSGLSQIPMRSGMVLAFHSSGLTHLLPQNRLVPFMDGPAYITTRYDNYSSQTHTWLIFRTNDESRRITEQLGDSLINMTTNDSALCSILHDSLLFANFPLGKLFSSISYYITHHNNYLIISATEDAIRFYHQEIQKGSMQGYPLYEKAFASENKRSVSWTLWLQPSLLNNSKMQNAESASLSGIFETLSIRWSNKKEIARCFIKINIANRIAIQIPLQTELLLPSIPLFSPTLLTGKDSTLVIVTSQQMIGCNLQGQILWKRILEHPISSAPQTINWYPETGSSQLVYVSHKKLYAIQHEGRDLPGFPIELPIKKIMPVNGHPTHIIWENQDGTCWSTDKNGQSKMLFKHPYPDKDVQLFVPTSSLYSLWIVNNDGAATGYKTNGQIEQIASWTTAVTSPVILIQHAEAMMNGMVFSDANGSIIYQNFDSSRKPEIWQRNKPSVLIHAEHSTEIGNIIFWVWESNALKITSSTQKIITSIPNIEKGSYRLLYQDLHYRLIYDQMQERLLIFNHRWEMVAGSPLYGALPFAIGLPDMPITIILTHQNKLLFFSIP